VNAIALWNGMRVEGPHQAPADVNADGVIDGRDRNLLLTYLFQPPVWLFAWMPDYTEADGMPREVRFSASDPRGTTSRSVAIEVRNTPVLHELPARVGRIGDTVELVAVMEDDLEPVKAFINPFGMGPSGPTYFGPLGDADLDGTVTVADFARQQELASGVRTPTALEMRVTDVNGNGAIDDDGLPILEIAWGLTQPSYLYYLEPTMADVGSHDVVVFAFNAASRQLVHRSARIVVLEPPVATGQVTNAAGEGVAAVAVELRALESDGRTSRQRVMTDEAGGYELRSTSATHGRLRARLAGFTFVPRAHVDVPLDSGASIDFLALPRAGAALPLLGRNALAGKVMSAGREPLAGAEVRVRGVRGTRFNARVRSGAGGEYAVEHVPDGELVVLARRKGRRFPRLKLSVGGGEVRVLDLQAR
jgi:hypothetical protein